MNLTKADLYNMVKGQMIAAKEFKKHIIQESIEGMVKYRFEKYVKSMNRMEQDYKMQLNSLSHYYNKKDIQEDALILEGFIKFIKHHVSEGNIKVKGI